MFELIRRSRNHAGILCAFDLLEIDGEDLRRVPIEPFHDSVRLARLLRSPQHGLVLNEHFNGDGAVIFKHVCKLGLRGYRIEAARLVLPLRPHRTLEQSQENPKAPAVKREAEEDWR